MDIDETFIRAHQFPFPRTGEQTTRTSFTICFDPELTDIDILLEDVFSGGKPFYTPGVCRPITPDGQRYSVGALACPIPEEESDDVTYDIHYPTNNTLWFDVTATQMEVYVRDTVDASRIVQFCGTLSDRYGVELDDVTDLPAVPQPSHQSFAKDT